MRSWTQWRNGDCTMFFFNDTATTEIYTLSLHDALPIYHEPANRRPLYDEPFSADGAAGDDAGGQGGRAGGLRRDRKSTRLNSSHANISYAVFCLKKKNRYNCSIRHTLRQATTPTCA